MTHSIFICVEDLLPSQANLLISEEINRINKRYIVNTCLFFEHPFQSHFDINCSVLNIGHINSCVKMLNPTTIIATKLNHVELIKNVNANKIFYVFDPEFLDDTNFLRNNNLYRSISLISRSKTHSKLIKNYCNIEPKVCDFNLEKIIGEKQWK